MTYEEALDYIYSRRKFQKSNGFERIERLLDLLGNPHKELKFIHVVGTNGKGSTSTALSNILTQSGYTVGLFTSPFVVEFGERIRVKGEFMPKETIAKAVETVKSKVDLMERENLHPTVFEVTTALGMLYFRERNCDFVVLEAGIGGGHDSTNVIPSPLLSVFTHISLDHADMLGNTPEEIATEKSGIIKKGTTVISYPCEGDVKGFIPQKESVTAIIKAKACEMGCDFISPSMKDVNIIKSDITGSEFTAFGMRVKTRLCGVHQVGNMLTAATAAIALRERGVSLSDEAVVNGIAKTVMPARMETVSEKPMVILDGGHNEGCMLALSALIDEYLGDKNIVMLTALMKDKDTDRVLDIIAPRCGEMIMTNVDPIRGETTEVLAEKASRHCKKVSCEADAKKAFLSVKERLTENDVLIVAGSFYLASEIRNKFFT